MQKIIYPKRINEGGTVGFFAPSDPVLPRRIEYVNKGIDLLKSWGFFPETIEDEVFNKWETLRTTQERITEFNSKLQNPKLDILIAVWGGKNSNDLLEKLDYGLIRKNNKPIIGTSDIAVLLNAITEHSRIVTFHGPNVLGKLNQTKETGLPFNNLSYSKITQLLPKKDECRIHTIQPGKSVGTLVGGSLGTFTLGLSGTKNMPSFEKIIFFFESASLDYYKTRQHLQHLKMTGFAKKVVGVIVGAMTKIDKQEFEVFEKFLIDYFENKKIPILSTNAFGHGFYYNPTFPIGLRVTLNTESDNMLQPEDELYESIR
ncbi:S66 peptidase family protein [Desulfobacter curvatus]|uniref:S66 peptidase family protein n=1 Tax=Desulfobacter curvatus TaxID=2290 RepID=UPI00035E47AD|nr:LD-carboxypeptidase [Desulfobacter curvatus]